MTTPVKHTAGPWNVEKESDHRFPIRSVSGYFVGEVYNTSGYPENIANAHLWSASPELLEYAILEEEFTNGRGDNWIPLFEEHGWDREEETAIDFLDRLRQKAISKARGES
jgi:hypothetical protein